MLISGIKEIEQKKIIEVFSHYKEIEKVVLFGSRAIGSNKSNSDLDFTLFGNELNLSFLFKIESEFDDLLLPYKFDLSLYQQIINPDLIAHINRVGKTIYTRN
jgi:predicted nucleotidyltransferase